MRVHRCAEPGCRELIKPGFDYCEKHYTQRVTAYQEQKRINESIWNQSKRGQALNKEQTKRYDSTRRQELHDGFYTSKRWLKISTYVKRRDAYTDGVWNKLWDDGELIVDHIVPRRLLEGEAQYDMENLWLLDRRTHNRKTGYERKLPDEKLRTMTSSDWVKILRRMPKDNQKK